MRAAYEHIRARGRGEGCQRAAAARAASSCAKLAERVAVLRLHEGLLRAELAGEEEAGATQRREGEARLAAMTAARVAETRALALHGEKERSESGVLYGTQRAVSEQVGYGAHAREAALLYSVYNRRFAVGRGRRSFVPRCAPSRYT